LAIARVRDQLSLAPTSRIKNTGTILEKLRRNGGSGLKSMQDLGGMRIVGAFDRRGQDEVVQHVCDLFAGEARAPKVIDRRIEPMHGYAAGHVIVFPDDAPIEIQVRTEWQHEWAELFEKLADRVGRGIRYGEPPVVWWTDAEFEAMDTASREVTHISYDLRMTMVRLALAIAGMAAAVEDGVLSAPGDPELDEARRTVDRYLVEFRQSVEELDTP
jgi:ppGpp synthetase/RelA/SpoT-type nucleotidyltranferase